MRGFVAPFNPFVARQRLLLLVEIHGDVDGGTVFIIHFVIGEGEFLLVESFDFGSHRVIFNRHGQKLYEWTDWSTEKSGWDGKYNGHPVKDGVYFVYVKARGADGRDYSIRRDVNLLRNFNTTESTNQ